MLTQRKRNPKFKVGQIVVWKVPQDERHLRDGQPCRVTDVIRYDSDRDTFRYQVSNGNSSNGWPEKKFRPLTKKERGV